MTAGLLRREIGLAGVALLAAVIALALTTGRSHRTQNLPQPVGSWYRALAAERAPGGFGRKTACGQVLRPGTEGVSHPVLPCGAKIYLAVGDERVLTQVIDRGPVGAGHELELTEPLAAAVGLRGVTRIHWAFAGGP